MHYRTRDLDEAIQVVGSVYCPHELYLDRRASALDTHLTASAAGTASLVQLAYGARVEVDAGEFPDLFLFMRCTGGEGLVRQGGVETKWQPGATIPVSAGRRTRFDFGARFEQSTFRPDTAALETCCTRLIGSALDDGLKFELAPFSPELERTWSSLLDLLGTMPATAPEAVRRALQELVLTTVLTGHRHNYADWLLRPEHVTRPARLVRRAEDLIRERMDDTTLTVSDIAHALGVSMRALQAAFHERRRSTPTAYLRQIRLEQVHQRLLQAAEGDTVSDVAMAHGFFHLGRFAQQYRAQFGEAPAETLRSRHRRQTSRLHTPAIAANTTAPATTRIRAADGAVGVPWST